ncbi:MAG TPA: hypothetical protein VMG09_13625 [Bacteroidota bacterium]|nr:hypothetical protein [Bacteroidota bacterium]
MTHIEQHKMILELKDYTHKMNRRDLEEFDMFVKRDKDDEDLDNHSRSRLKELYDQYVPARLRNW